MGTWLKEAKRENRHFIFYRYVKYLREEERGKGRGDRCSATLGTAA